MNARLVGGFLLVIVLGLGIGTGGCKAHEGQKVVGYSGKTNNWTKAPDDGRYSLRGAGPNAVTYYVQKGEKIGFRKNSDGTTVAIAGDNAPVHLDKPSAKQAYWKFAQKDPYSKN